MEVSSQLHSPTALPLGGSARYPFYRRLDGPRNRSGRCGGEKNLLSLPRIEPRPSSPSLYLLSYPGSYICGCPKYVKGVFSICNLRTRRILVTRGSHVEYEVESISNNTMCNWYCRKIVQWPSPDGFRSTGTLKNQPAEGCSTWIISPYQKGW
jgi:hypothetical protein